MTYLQSQMYYLSSTHQRRPGKTCVMELELGQTYTWEDVNTFSTEKWAGYPKDTILQLLRRGQL